MSGPITRYPAAFGMLAALVCLPLVASADEQGHSKGHRKVIAEIVSERSGLPIARAPDGATYTLNPNISRRHGHEAPKVGDQVTMVFDENNQIIEVHPGTELGAHRFVTGKLVYVGKTKKELKLDTPQGEQVFPLERLEIKTGVFPEGSLVTAELNEAGTVIDLHRAEGARER